jgi:SAM-dependent methyltransferase
MRKFLRDLYTILKLFSLDPRRDIPLLRGLRQYFRDWRILMRQQRQSSIVFPMGRLRPYLGEKDAESGVANGHYFHQDLLVARRIFQRRPARHVDVGSRIDGFVAHVASFRRIDVLDFRLLNSLIPNVFFLQCDMMGVIPQPFLECCDSLSCLHALEHFGLGRYGDKIEFDGYLTGLENLEKILAPGGILYLSVPIGLQRIEYNAHRVFSTSYLWPLLAGKFRIVGFSYVDDAGDLQENVPFSEQAVAENFQCRFGCGIFELEKAADSGGRKKKKTARIIEILGTYSVP